MEYITVFDGTLTLILADEQFIIKENESIKFSIMVISIIVKHIRIKLY
jgi:hypothetical protein